MKKLVLASMLAVIERRIALEAKRHLLFSTLEIKEIGDLLGYPDPAYFTLAGLFGDPAFRELGV